MSAVRLLPLLPLLPLLAGCGLDPVDEGPRESESSVVEIVPPGDGIWRGASVPFEAVLDPELVGARIVWECGAGDLVGFFDREAVVWRTPAAGPAWLQVTVVDGAESHVRRRWFDLPRGPVELRADGGPVVEPGPLHVDAVDGSPYLGGTRFWGCDGGELAIDARALGATWTPRAAGLRRIWVEVVSDGETARDTLEVEVAQRPPWFEIVWDDFEGGDCGDPGQLFLHARDLNGDPLSLEVVDAGGLLVDAIQEHGPGFDFEGSWTLVLHAPVGSEGPFELRLRLSDGANAVDRSVVLAAGCP